MYTKAIVRKPGKNFSEGITTASLGKPDFNRTLLQHEAYCNALLKCGLELIVLDADEKYADACFVEDTAVVTEKAAVITKPGTASRQGEEQKIAEILCRYKKIETIKYPGTVEGGDILRRGDHFYIGLSKRTNDEGARQLAFLLLQYGYTSSVVSVSSVLHLKTGITWLGGNNFVSIAEFTDPFSAFNVIKTEPGEEYMANCLLINNYLLIPKGFEKTKRKFPDAGYNIIELDMSEFEKMDGGLTCLSLLF